MMKVEFQGEPVEVNGIQPVVGDKAPNSVLINRKNKKIELKDFFGEKPVILSVVPDVETRVCELQTKRFSDELNNKKVIFLTISRNTVDEFNKWNDENYLDLNTLSDTEREFGKNYGLNIDLDGNELLTRSVFLVDTEQIIRYVEIVEEITHEPNYNQLIKEIDKL